MIKFIDLKDKRIAVYFIGLKIGIVILPACHFPPESNDYNNRCIEDYKEVMRRVKG